MPLNKEAKQPTIYGLQESISAKMIDILSTLVFTALLKGRLNNIIFLFLLFLLILLL